jgi:3-oxoacyl-[acyl-carrier-protein] synthase II
MTQQREIIVTGLGVVSPIGIGQGPFWESLRAGRSGVKPVGELQGTPFPVLYGGEVTDFDGKQYVTPRKSLKLMSREVQTAFAVASLAMQESGLVPANLDHDRFGVVFGSEMLFSSPKEMVEVYLNCTVDGQFDISRWGTRMSSDLFPLWMLKYLPNMPACHVAIAHEARGPNNTFTLGEVSGLHALQEATRYIERGLADVMIAGGTGSRLNISSLLFRCNFNLTHRSGDPAAACRPFEANREGMVNGEGAGAMVVETAENAAVRGAKSLARVLGFGNSFEPPSDAGKARTGRAIRQSIVRALRDASLTAADVGFVTANGLGTIHDDIAEAQAIRAELGDVPVWAPKSYFGNLGGGTSAVDAAATICALTHGVIPATLNYEVPDPRCPVNVSAQERPIGSQKVALVLSQSLTGQAAAAVFRAL